VGTTSFGDGENSSTTPNSCEQEEALRKEKEEEEAAKDETGDAADETDDEADMDKHEKSCTLLAP